MDIGQLNFNKRQAYTSLKSKTKLEGLSLPAKNEPRKTLSEAMLPSVRRELLIERKLYLMKKSSETSSPFSSPVRTSRIRSIISEVRT